MRVSQSYFGKGLIVMFILWAIPNPRLSAQRTIDFTLDAAVDIAMNNSYRVKKLRMDIERTRKRLEAERAGLKSRVYLTLTAPEFEAISDYKWNSTLRRNEIVRENSRLWQMNLAVEQPVILFGYPTDGYLSLNNQIYRYSQLDGGRDVQYYNRYFIQYEQPLFRPNRLRNEIEEARINLRQRELNFSDDLVDLIDDVADDYFDLFERVYRDTIAARHLVNLAQAARIISARDTADSNRLIEQTQIEVELANTREQISRYRSEFRMQSARMKQNLRLQQEDSLAVRPSIRIRPMNVYRDQAVRHGFALNPQLQLDQLRRREQEIDLENTKGDGSFGMNLEMTYGLEKSDPSYARLWASQDNSYTVSLQAYLPIWDWGRHKADVEAEQIALNRRNLEIQETRSNLQSEITNDVQDVLEYHRRTATLQENMARAAQVSRMSLSQYQARTISLRDLLQTFDREMQTAENFLEAYLGYRNALLNLMEDTYYDYERDVPLLQRFTGGSS